MSLANYLTQVAGIDKTFSVPTIYISREPTGVDDGARIADCLEYLGNATYPVNPPTTQIIPSSTTFLPVFQRPGTDLSGDYLRVRPAVDLFNFQQLLNFEYSLNVINNSKTLFDTRFAIYDLDMNVLQTYEPVRYDPSSNPFQPPALDSFTFKGFSVQIPAQAEYGFLEISGAGNLNVAFDYANSQLVNAIDNSDPAGGIPPGSRSSKNIFVVDWFAKPFDISGGISGDIAALEADVAQLQIETSLLQVDVANLQTGKVNVDGTSQMTGALQVDGSLYPSGWSQGVLLGNGARASLIEGTDPNASYNTAIGVYSNSTLDNRSVYLWTGDKAGNQKLNPTWSDATAVIEDDFDVNVPLKANAGLTISGVIDQNGVVGDNVFRAPIIADFGINMNGNGIGSLGMFGSGADQATNKGYVDTADNLRLPLAGGTMNGAINMANQNINNLPNPTLTQQPATKIYVDTALNGKLNTTGGSLTGALNMTTQQINNLGAPLSSTDAATKGYVDGVIVSGAFLPKAGGTMTGAINMSSQQINNLGNPVLLTDAANKAYVDSQTQNELPLAGGTMTGTINMNNNRITNIPNVPTASTDAINLNVANNLANQKLALSGGTMNGTINMNANRITGLPTPTISSDAASKGYVDSKDPAGNFLPLTGGNMTGSIDMGNNPITSLTPSSGGIFQGAAQYAQMVSYMTGDYPATGNPPASGYYPRDGSKAMTNTLNLNGNQIAGLTNIVPQTSVIGVGGARLTALSTPVGFTDATTRGFCDQQYLVKSPPVSITQTITNTTLLIEGTLTVDGTYGNVPSGSLNATYVSTQAIGTDAPYSNIPNGLDIEITDPTIGNFLGYNFTSGSSTDNSRLYLSNSLPVGTFFFIKNFSGLFAPSLLVRAGNTSSFTDLMTLGGQGATPPSFRTGLFVKFPGVAGWQPMFGANLP